MRTVVITGAASGLGKAIANYYAIQQWRVVIADIQDQAGKEVVEDIRIRGGMAYYFHCNIGKPKDIFDLARFTEETTGECHLLINNAGVASAGTLMQSDEAEWHRMINLDLMSCVRCSMAFIPLLKYSASESSPNAIVNIASLAGLALMPSMITYNVTKAAVIALSESLRGELKRDHIHVAAACPSFFKTNLTSSMITSDQATINRVNGWMEKSALTADSVARDIAEGVAKGEILILSDQKLKRYLALMGWLYTKIFRK